MEEENHRRETDLLAAVESVNQRRSAFVLYRLPGEKQIRLMAGPMLPMQGQVLPEHGFVTGSFLPGAGDHYISPEVFITIDDADDAALKPLALLSLYHKEAQGTAADKEFYCTNVEKAVDAMREGDFFKTVLSRFHEVKHDTGTPTLLAYYYRLTQAYPDAFVCFLSGPETGTWIGCTPEALLRAQGISFSTMALAGTAHAPEAEEDATMEKLFTEKERVEQAVVTNYIREALEPETGFMTVKGPVLKRAGALYHLATYFEGSVKDASAQAYGKMVYRLHPTPAVCGLPKAPAMDFIIANEGYDRELYTGFLGPVNLPQSLDIFVNLRCMQVFPGRLRLYAGAGLVEASVPQAEWQETAHKMHTLLSVLNYTA